MNKTLSAKELYSIFLHTEHVTDCAALDGAGCSCGLDQIRSGLDQFQRALQNVEERFEIWC